MSVSSSEKPQISAAEYAALRARFHENRDKFTREQLAAYADQWVAWWPDGSRIYDADASLTALEQRLHTAGYRTAFFMLELMPKPENFGLQRWRPQQPGHRVPDQLE